MKTKETNHQTELCECGRRLEMHEYENHEEIEVGYRCNKCNIQWVKEWREDNQEN